MIGYRSRMTRPTMRPVGEQLREWRQRRRMSQLDLACEADISTRHLSFLETGRSAPSREMLLRLVERLDVPLRERNALLLAGGFAPMFRERRLDDPEFEAARRAIELVLKGHGPYPALAVDRHWQLAMMNDAVPMLLEGVAPALLQPPVNVLRLSLHPQGLAPRIVNLAQWRGHLLARLHSEIVASADAQLEALMRELCAYPMPPEQGPTAPVEIAGVAVPFQLRTAEGVLSFIGTTTVFGTPVDITLSELAMETFFPADEATGAALQRAAAARARAAEAAEPA
jgi:transcriptional regulator with XRE-family HTH domain